MYEADLTVSVVSFISRSMYEADLTVSVVSFISRSMGSTKSSNSELFSERTSSISSRK